MLRLAKHCVLSVLGVVDDDNVGVNYDNIVFTMKEAKLHGPVAKDYQNLSKRFSKGSERLAYWNDYKAKSENKDATKVSKDSQMKLCRS